MKTLVFVTCILAAVTVGDALIMDNILNNIINTLISKAVNFKDLIDFHMTFAQCVAKLGLLKLISPEIPFCIAEKKNLLDEEGGIKWNKTLIYSMALIRDSNHIDKIKEIFEKCKEEADNFEGSKKEKSMKAIECGLSMIKVIGQRLILL